MRVFVRSGNTCTHSPISNRPHLTGRKIAIVLIRKQQWPDLKPHVRLIVAAANAATAGSYVEVEISYESEITLRTFESAPFKELVQTVTVSGSAPNSSRSSFLRGGEHSRPLPFSVVRLGSPVFRSALNSEISALRLHNQWTNGM